MIYLFYTFVRRHFIFAAVSVPRGLFLRTKFCLHIVGKIKL